MTPLEIYLASEKESLGIWGWSFVIHAVLAAVELHDVRQLSFQVEGLGHLLDAGSLDDRQP